jgi:hypothetical protein
VRRLENLLARLRLEVRKDLPEMLRPYERQRAAEERAQALPGASAKPADPRQHTFFKERQDASGKAP